MDDKVVVEEVQSFEHLQSQVFHHLVRQTAVQPAVVQEVAQRHPLQNQVNIMRIMQQRRHVLHDILMLQRAVDQNLPFQKPGQELLVGLFPQADALDGHFLGVGGAVGAGGFG